MTTMSEPDNNAQPDLAGYLRTEAPPPADDGRRSGTATDADDDSMRDMEKSLVERIADVDDDRRRTATQLQKAFNSHRDETAARLRRGFNGLLALIAAVTLVLAGALGWGLWQQARERARQAEALAEITQRVDALAAAVEAGEPPPTMLAGLAGRVDELSDLVADLSGTMSALRDRPPAPLPDGDAIQPLRRQQQRLADELKTLGETLEALPARAREIAEIAADEIARRVAGETARDTAAEALRAAQADAAPAALAEPQPPTAISAAELDRLIDAQLARLEKEYQRLATRVSSPAVRQAGSLPDPDADADPTTPALSSPVAATADTAAQGSEPAGDLPAQISVGDRRYALQLIGFYSRTELDDFIASNPLPPRVYWREESFRGQPWFVLIHSLHPDLTAAGDAQRDLPDALAGLDLWIRDLPSDARLNVIATGGN